MTFATVSGNSTIDPKGILRDEQKHMLKSILTKQHL